jgi:hypothetical protein
LQCLLDNLNIKVSSFEIKGVATMRNLISVMFLVSTMKVSRDGLEAIRDNNYIIFSEHLVFKSFQKFARDDVIKQMKEKVDGAKIRHEDQKMADKLLVKILRNEHAYDSLSEDATEEERNDVMKSGRQAYREEEVSHGRVGNTDVNILYAKVYDGNINKIELKNVVLNLLEGCAEWTNGGNCMPFQGDQQVWKLFLKLIAQYPETFSLLLPMEGRWHQLAQHAAGVVLGVSGDFYESVRSLLAQTASIQDTDVRWQLMDYVISFAHDYFPRLLQRIQASFHPLHEFSFLATDDDATVVKKIHLHLTSLGDATLSNFIECSLHYEGGMHGLRLSKGNFVFNAADVVGLLGAVVNSTQYFTMFLQSVAFFTFIEQVDGNSGEHLANLRCVKNCN